MSGRLLRDLVNVDGETLDRLLGRTSDQPWIVRVLTGGAAWVAAILFLVFLFATKLLDMNSAPNQFIASFVLIGGATAARIFIRDNLLVEQAGLASSLAGQAMLIVGVRTALHSWSATWAAGMGLEVLMILVYPDRVARFISTLALFLCAFLLIDLDYAWLLPVLVFACAGMVTFFLLHGEILPPRLVWPARYVALGAAAVLPALFIPALVDKTQEVNMGPQNAAAVGLCLLYAIYAIGKDPWRWVMIAAVLGVLYLGRSAPGLGSGLLLMGLGFYTVNRVLIGWGILATGIFLFYFYYNMDITLLAKSITLMSTGALLLLLRAGMWFLEKRT